MASTKKPAPPKKPAGTTATWTTNAEGVTKGSSFTPAAPEKPKKPEDEQARLASKYGLYQSVIDQYPDFAPLIAAAVKDYVNGLEWTDEKFWAEYNKTQFAIDRSKAQELFDINIAGPNSDTYQKKIADTTQVVLQNAQRYGVTISDQEAAAQAQEIVRSDLSQSVVDAWWASKYTGQTTDMEADVINGKPTYGAVGQIQKSLKDTANSYGLKMDEALLRQKTGEALGQGDRWQEYLQGQDQFFIEQAKLMYPKAAHLFDTKNLTQIAEPYLQEASSVLGTSPAEMDITDPKWTAFLNGENGPLSKDEWVRVMRTDSKYGYDKSLNARKEYSNLTDQLFAAFGMA